LDVEDVGRFIKYCKFPYQGVSTMFDVLRFQPYVAVQMLESGLP